MPRLKEALVWHSWKSKCYKICNTVLDWLKVFSFLSKQKTFTFHWNRSRLRRFKETSTFHLPNVFPPFAFFIFSLQPPLRASLTKISCFTMSRKNYHWLSSTNIDIGSRSPPEIASSIEEEAAVRLPAVDRLLILLKHETSIQRSAPLTRHVIKVCKFKSYNANITA